MNIDHPARKEVDAFRCTLAVFTVRLRNRAQRLRNDEFNKANELIATLKQLRELEQIDARLEDMETSNAFWALIAPVNDAEMEVNKRLGWPVGEYLKARDVA